MRACRPMSVEREQPTQPGSVRVDTISPWRKDAIGRDSPGGTDHLRVIRTWGNVIVVLCERISLDRLALALAAEARQIVCQRRQRKNAEMPSSFSMNSRSGVTNAPKLCKCALISRRRADVCRR